MLDYLFKENVAYFSKLLFTNYILPFSPRSGQKSIGNLLLQMRKNKIRGAKCCSLVPGLLSQFWVLPKPVFLLSHHLYFFLWPSAPPKILLILEKKASCTLAHLTFMQSEALDDSPSKILEMKWKQSRHLTKVAFSLLHFGTSSNVYPETAVIPQIHCIFNNISIAYNLAN